VVVGVVDMVVADLVVSAVGVVAADLAGLAAGVQAAAGPVAAGSGAPDVPARRDGRGTRRYICWKLRGAESFQKN